MLQSMALLAAVSISPANIWYRSSVLHRNMKCFARCLWLLVEVGYLTMMTPSYRSQCGYRCLYQFRFTHNVVSVAWRCLQSRRCTRHCSLRFPGNKAWRSTSSQPQNYLAQWVKEFSEINATWLRTSEWNWGHIAFQSSEHPTFKPVSLKSLFRGVRRFAACYAFSSPLLLCTALHPLWELSARPIRVRSFLQNFQAQTGEALAVLTTWLTCQHRIHKRTHTLTSAHFFRALEDASLWARLSASWVFVINVWMLLNSSPTSVVWSLYIVLYLQHRSDLLDISISQVGHKTWIRKNWMRGYYSIVYLLFLRSSKSTVPSQNILVLECNVQYSWLWGATHHDIVAAAFGLIIERYSHPSLLRLSFFRIQHLQILKHLWESALAAVQAGYRLMRMLKHLGGLKEKINCTQFHHVDTHHANAGVCAQWPVLWQVPLARREGRHRRHFEPPSHHIWLWGTVQNKGTSSVEGKFHCCYVWIRMLHSWLNLHASPAWSCGTASPVRVSVSISGTCIRSCPICSLGLLLKLLFWLVSGGAQSWKNEQLEKLLHDKTWLCMWVWEKKCCEEDLSRMW